ncbi:anaphase-promoting complex subunit 6-like [Lytechinus variegatus]|uniref:anaphase-promoting complex subunit 6-like n=1 Tax=Lytechinus variegatus TaxID=7654 RepID=UPI001BB27C25|nr:anaphase-promoting complex subunit 6-like [Lytechinus variegatus]
MDLRNTDQELTRTLFTLQSKIRDLKNKINQDEVDDDDDDSEKTDYPSSWSSNGHRNDSFSTPSSQKTKSINLIKEENEEEPVMEVKQVKQLHTAVTVTRSAVNEVKAENTVNVTAVNGNSTQGNVINGTIVNHNANGYSRNTNNSLDQTIRPSVNVSLRKSVTSDGLKNYSNLEKPNLPPPPPPPVSASPTPSLKSTSSSEVVHRFAMKEESKRDSMSSSSYVSSSSSFTSSLEELRLQDVPRDLRSSGRSFDRMTFEEEEEEEESHDAVNQDEDSSIKDNQIDFDDNGNEETTSDETTEASKLMESIWAEVAMFS